MHGTKPNSPVWECRRRVLYDVSSSGQRATSLLTSKTSYTWSCGKLDTWNKRRTQPRSKRKANVALRRSGERDKRFALGSSLLNLIRPAVRPYAQITAFTTHYCRGRACLPSLLQSSCNRACWFHYILYIRNDRTRSLTVAPCASHPPHLMYTGITSTHKPHVKPETTIITGTQLTHGVTGAMRTVSVDRSFCAHPPSVLRSPFTVK